MATTKKGQVLANELADAIKKRLSAFVVTEGFDTSQRATISVYTTAGGVIGEPGAFIRVKNDWDDNTSSLNAIGLAQTAFTPHVIQIAFEAEDAPGAGAEVNSWTTLLPIVGEALGKGAKVEIWLETAGAVPVVTTFDTPAKRIASFASLYWPLMAQV